MVNNTFLVKTTKLFLSDNVVQEFIKNDQTKFDLVMVPSFFQECTVVLDHQYGALVVNLVPIKSIRNKIQKYNKIHIFYACNLTHLI